MGTLGRFAVAAAAGAMSLMSLMSLVGCYSPSFGACEVRCRVTVDCPSGYACMGDRFCHASGTEPLCACKPLRCDEVPNSCGAIDDTCGGTITCGDCTRPQTCGGGGTPGVCGDPASCQPLACQPNECGPGVDSCGVARTCPGCPIGKRCMDGQCVVCDPQCVDGELACGSDGCGGTCGSCPDERWTCHPAGVCCIQDGERCNPNFEGCNCCPGLFCINWICQSAAGCAMASDLGAP